MPNARDLRLQADYEQVRALARRSGGRLTLDSTRGRPPDEYVVTYHCRTIETLRDGKPVYRATSRVRIKLPARYPLPSAPPVCELQTPVFNPHVYPNRVVCMGSWQTSEYLEDVVLRLGAMLQFDRRYMSVLDPANEQAMYWVTQNLLLLPTDHVEFQGEDPDRPVTDSIKPTADLPSISDWMRQPVANEPASGTERADASFTGLVEDTSLDWQELE